MGIYFIWGICILFGFLSGIKYGVRLRGTIIHAVGEVTHIKIDNSFYVGLGQRDKSGMHKYIYYFLDGGEKVKLGDKVIIMVKKRNVIKKI